MKFIIQKQIFKVLIHTKTVLKIKLLIILNIFIYVFKNKNLMKEGFEPSPFRNRAQIYRLRPLGHFISHELQRRISEIVKMITKQNLKKQEYYNEIIYENVCLSVKEESKIIKKKLIANLYIFDQNYKIYQFIKNKNLMKEGFEPSPFRNRAQIYRLRPLGHFIQHNQVDQNCNNQNSSISNEFKLINYQISIVDQIKDKI
ncbi:transmembrane protein, putative (macronuclear) [Tetrahymena thermophila SB210]|uniref:Transmembrane protein, putative n=1 Tax=Tetrahymena thermophila (strain SB210) TaxID=312017 RepID=W7XHZ3_TETTS|nr:transmembrane protein, putative [Tetrahymena thermophila SB210]EWS72839.1 transmembrane protein, putative [Tetrahymena thermophila SB210]|eukprot:XP_012654630.1 transmembrane protein, putative [Tetrahymena thermophila SB210]